MNAHPSHEPSPHMPPALTLGQLSIPLVLLQWLVKDVPLLIVVALLSWFVIIQEQHIQALQTNATHNTVTLTLIQRDIAHISDYLRIPARSTGVQP